MKRYLKKLIPCSFLILRDRIRLSRIRTVPFDRNPLAAVDQVDLDAMFHSQACQKGWAAAEKNLAPLSFPEGGGGVNSGDRRAIYHLIRTLKPRSVLEVGTHIGASTVYIATALKHLRSVEGETSYHLVTIDIRDVNNPITKPWLEYGAQYAPIELIKKTECDHLVRFITSDSMDYFSRCEQKYDFIFLDGDHSAATVYREIPAAMGVLHQEGHILLHDYFPDLRPLWPNGAVVPGPYLAARRLAEEGANIKVLPLGKLPWLTKLHSHTTSLALLGKNQPSYPLRRAETTRLASESLWGK